MNRVMTKSHSLPPRPAFRPRVSLQESKTKSTSFSKRRLERHSSVATQQRLELSLLEHVQVEFVKAFVPANKLSQPRYVMRITNAALQQSWEMGRTFKEFYDLKEAIVSELDHGHFCPSNCPWLYMYATHHFPRRHLFRSRSPSVISARLTELQTFLNEVLRMSREKRNVECAISGEVLPRILYDFLYEGMVFDRSDFSNTILEDRVSLTGVGAGNGNRGRRLSCEQLASTDEACSICRRSLLGSGDAFTTITPPSSNGDTATSSGSGSGSGSRDSDDVDAQSLTTLECGHVFHDDCILQKLNEQLKCPLCVDSVAAA